MKIKFSLSILLFVFFMKTVSGQVPQGFNYQAAAFNSAGAPIANTQLQVKMSILSDTILPVIIYEELHSAVATNVHGVFNLVIGNGVKQSGSAASFSAIDWNSTPLFLKVQINYQGSWKILGSAKLWSVPYAMVAGSTNGINAGAKLSVTSTDDLGSEALFEVKRQDGQPVFAVYPDAVNIWVPQTGAKGPKGGFTVGGYGTTKEETYDFFRVTPDSVRIYIDPTPDEKGAKGGFAVGGYGQTKSIENMYFNLTGTSEISTVNASPQILWYPAKNAFLAGNVHIGAADSVGDYSTALGYQSIAMGDYSQAFGYKAKAFGDYSTSIGKNSVAGSVLPAAHNAFAFGDAARATGSDSYAFGSGALASGTRSFAFGSVGLDDSQVPTTTPTRATGSYSVALGMGASALNTGSMSLGVGTSSSGIASSTFGYYSSATSGFATALGFRTTASAAYSLAAGSNAVAAGDNSLAIGTFGLNADGSVNTSRPTKTFLSYSIALGMGAQANQKGDMALGVNTTSGGGYSTAMGYGASASGLRSISLGYNTQASGTNSSSFGASSQATNTNALALGNGSIASGVNSAAMGYQSQANGELSIAIGSYFTYTLASLPYFVSTATTTDFIIRSPTIAPSFKSISFNRANIANGKYSISIGNGNLSGDGGFALGSNNDATAFGAVAIGVSNKAVNTNTYAAGYNNLATGWYATAFGNNTYSKAFGSFVIGQYNIVAGDSTQWKSTDPLFIVGNGLSATDRSNAVTVYKNGRSIFTGEHANISLNDKLTRLMFIPGVGIQTTTSVYGVKSYVNRADTDVEYYYSGYFYDTGTAGAYKGLYADERTGGSIDVAEYIYDSKGNTEPADVIVADPDAKESVILSSKPYQTSVLGVVSTKPHLTMGMELIADEVTGEPLSGVKATRLALNGRVPVKITGENGPVEPGDLITTSSTPGHAMKWSLLDVSKAKDFEEMKSMLAENERRRNAVIGKAVESFSGTGTGKIMVLISLQ